MTPLASQINKQFQPTAGHYCNRNMKTSVHTILSVF